MNQLFDRITGPADGIGPRDRIECLSKGSDKGIKSLSLSVAQGYLEKALCSQGVGRSDLNLKTTMLKFANGLTLQFPQNCQDRNVRPHVAHSDPDTLSLPWSQGQTEGQVNRLNFLKRQSFGRATFDLLRLRVLFEG